MRVLHRQVCTGAQRYVGPYHFHAPPFTHPLCTPPLVARTPFPRPHPFRANGDANGVVRSLLPLLRGPLPCPVSPHPLPCPALPALPFAHMPGAQEGQCATPPPFHSQAAVPSAQAAPHPACTPSVRPSARAAPHPACMPPPPG